MEKSCKKDKNRRGFTLVEILVVMTILGFIMSMAAPRFGGISAQAIKITGKTNEANLTTFITAYIRDYGKYPGGLINIVSIDSLTNNFLKPMVSDQDPDNGMEVISFEADSRCRFRVHYLNGAEASELRDLGIVHVYNLNSSHDRNVTTKAPFMERVHGGTAVLMIGGGDSDNDGTIAPGEIDGSEAGWGENDLNFCMVFGLGNETDLVKKGYIFNSSTCPLATIVPKNYAYGWYCLVIPRLESTSKRLKADVPCGDGRFTAFKMKTSSPAPAVSLAQVKTREVDIYKPQVSSFFSILNSCGEKFHPSSGDGYWGIDFDKNGDVGL